jgi:hypothetical protein
MKIYVLSSFFVLVASVAFSQTSTQKKELQKVEPKLKAVSKGKVETPVGVVLKSSKSSSTSNLKVKSNLIDIDGKSINQVYKISDSNHKEYKIKVKNTKK